MQQPEIKEQLMEARRVKGLTQEEVATLCGVSVRTIQRIELGEVTPRAYTVKLLSKALGVRFYETDAEETLEPDSGNGLDSEKAAAGDKSKSKPMKDSAHSVVYASAILGVALIFSTLIVMHSFALAVFLFIPSFLLGLLVWGIVSKRKALWIVSLLLLLIYGFLSYGMLTINEVRSVQQTTKTVRS